MTDPSNGPLPTDPQPTEPDLTLPAEGPGVQPEATAGPPSAEGEAGIEAAPGGTASADVPGPDEPPEGHVEDASGEAPTPDAAPTPERAPVEAAADEEAAAEETTTPEGPAPEAATDEAVAATAEVPPGPPDESVVAILALPEAAPPRRHRLRRLLLGTLGLLIFLLLASGAGFGAAFLVPRFADASPVPSSASPSGTPTASPTPTTTATTTPSGTTSASPGSSGSSRPSASPSRSPASSPTTLTYVVQRGDTLAGIAARFGVTVQAIVAANGLTDPNHIETGQRLVIPRP